MHVGRWEERRGKAARQFSITFLTKTTAVLGVGWGGVGQSTGSPAPSPGRLWPPLTFVQIADHRLLLQEVITQLLAEPERQHVVSERAGGKDTRERPPFLLAERGGGPGWGRGTGLEQGEAETKGSRLGLGLLLLPNCPPRGRGAQGVFVGNRKPGQTSLTMGLRAA